MYKVNPHIKKDYSEPKLFQVINTTTETKVKWARLVEQTTTNQVASNDNLSHVEGHHTGSSSITSLGKIYLLFAVYTDKKLQCSSLSLQTLIHWV